MIHIYKNNPTIAQRDGEQVSEGSGDAAISVGPLDAATSEESEAIKLAVRCALGFQTTGNTVIRPIGSSSYDWVLAPDDGNKPGEWTTPGGRLVIEDQITDYNTIFWVKAKANKSEQAGIDESVTLLVSALETTEEE